MDRTDLSSTATPCQDPVNKRVTCDCWGQYPGFEHRDMQMSVSPLRNLRGRFLSVAPQLKMSTFGDVSEEN